MLARLTQAARFDCEYGRGLANHLPMALASLARLGADDARLAAFEAEIGLPDPAPTHPEPM